MPDRIKQFQRIISGNIEASEYRFVGKSGEVIWVRTNARPIIKDGHTVGVQGVLVDITDRKNAELDRIATEKMQVVLEMAGAAAHEFNQPLQVLAGHLELMCREMPSGHKCNERIEKISDQINRLKSITEKLNKVTRYKTKDYVAGKKIIDIEASSD